VIATHRRVYTRGKLDRRMAPKKRTDQEMIAHLNKDVIYEGEELLLCRDFLKSLFDHKTEIEPRGKGQLNLFVALQNTGLEHFGIHGRNLLDFLFYKSHESYTRAVDYVASWLDTNRMTDGIRLLQKRVDPEIAHISWARLDVKDKDWQPLTIIEDLLNVFAIFLSKLDKHYKEKRATDFEAVLSRRGSSSVDIFGLLLSAPPTTLSSVVTTTTSGTSSFLNSTSFLDPK
jgi:hypothetical protein